MERCRFLGKRFGRERKVGGSIRWRFLVSPSRGGLETGDGTEEIRIKTLGNHERGILAEGPLQALDHLRDGAGREANLSQRRGRKGPSLKSARGALKGRGGWRVKTTKMQVQEHFQGVGIEGPGRPRGQGTGGVLNFNSEKKRGSDL